MRDSESIIDDINNGRITIEQGTSDFIQLFSKGIYLDLEECGKKLTDNAATALVQALKSPKSIITELDCTSYDEDGISPLIQYIINESQIRNLRSGNLTEEGCKDLASLILTNKHLESFTLFEFCLTDGAYLILLEAVLQSNITKFDGFDGTSGFDYASVAHLFRKSKLRNFSAYISAAQWPVFAKILPETQITTLWTNLDTVLAFDGIIEACRNLKSLLVYDDDSKDVDIHNFLWLLPLLNITYFECDNTIVPDNLDKKLSSTLAKSSLMKFKWDDYSKLPLSQAVLKEKRSQAGYRVAFLMFQWLVPLAMEKNGFNSLPRDVFLIILRQSMAPINLGAAYCNMVENNLRNLLGNHQFSPQSSNSCFTFFRAADAEHMLGQQQEEINQLRMQNAALSENLGQLKQTLFSLMPVLPQEALDKLGATQAFAHPEEGTPTAEPENKRLKNGGFNF